MCFYKNRLNLPRSPLHLKVAFKGDMCLFVGDWVRNSSGKGQRGQMIVYLKSGVCVDGEW